MIIRKTDYRKSMVLSFRYGWIKDIKLSFLNHKTSFLHVINSQEKKINDILLKNL